MAHFPEPEKTPEGPAYEGRLLHRADEEVVDQGASFDLQTLVSRRSVIGAVTVGVGTLTLAACSPKSDSSITTSSDSSEVSSSRSPSESSSSDTGSFDGDLPAGEIPDETAGPYPGDGSNGPDVLEESGIVRSDIRSSIEGDTTAEGVPLSLRFTVLDMANDDVPFAGVALYAWMCDAQGGYSMYTSGLEDVTYLRGVQVADEDGVVTFQSIFPGCYTGRWPHIHFEVYPDVDSITDSTNAISTSQMALPEDVSAAVYDLDEYSGSQENLSGMTLENDNVFSDDGAELQMATVTGDITSGFTASLVVRVDTTTEPSVSGSMPNMGGGPDGAGPGGGSEDGPENFPGEAPGDEFDGSDDS